MEGLLFKNSIQGPVSSDGAWGKIAETTLSSDTPTIEFANLGLENYRYFKLLMNLNNNLLNGEDLWIRLNDITTFTYRNVEMANTAGSINTYSRFILGRTYSNYPAFYEVLLSNIINSRKSIITRGSYVNASNYIVPTSYCGTQDTIANIVRISIMNESTGLFTAGSQLMLMGVK